MRSLHRELVGCADEGKVCELCNFRSGRVAEVWSCVEACSHCCATEGEPIHAFQRILAAIASRSAVTAGISRSFTFTAAAMFMAVGKESFDDCDILTWSLGCTGVLLPSGVLASWQQRLEITSFTFMLNCVPLPVIQTCRGNMSSC